MPILRDPTGPSSHSNQPSTHSNPFAFSFSYRNAKQEVIVDESGQIKLRHGDEEIRFQQVRPHFPSILFTIDLIFVQYIFV